MCKIKKLILFLLGLIPFALGLLMNTWTMTNRDSILPLKLIGIGFLIFWTALGFMTSKFERTPLKASMSIHLPSFLILLSIMYQEIIVGKYFSNLFGLFSQLYYLPLINLISSIESIFLSLTPWRIYFWTTSLMSFLVMVFCYHLGVHIRNKKEY